MKAQRTRGVGIIHAVVGFVVVAIAAGGGYSTRSWWSSIFAVSSQDGPVLSSAASTALMRARITPRSLAAAGVTSEETTALLARAATWWGDNGTACAASCAAIDGAGISVDALRRKALSGLASEGDLTALAAAVSAMNSARSTHDEKLDAYWAAATNGLEGDKVTKLLAYRENADAAVRLPTAYLVVSREESDATALRDALSEVATNGEGAASAAQTIVTTADGNGAVSAAKAYLTNNLGGITTAWTSAISG
jgi:hypothetical protein